MNIGKWFKRNGSTILTCLGAGGMIATVALTIKATLRARNACIDAGIKKDLDDLTKKDDLRSTITFVAKYVRVSIPEFIPPIAVGTGSLICIFGANVLSRRQQAALASAYTALASSFEAYRDKVETLCGQGTNVAIDKAIEQEKQDILDDRPPWDEVQTFYLDGCDKPAFFERTMEQVMKAEYHINRNFQLKGQVTFNEFREWLGLDPVEGGNEIGWDDYIGEVAFGYRWIDFNHRYFETDDGLMVCSIDMPFEPHSLVEEPF